MPQSAASEPGGSAEPPVPRTRQSIYIASVAVTPEGDKAADDRPSARRALTILALGTPVVVIGIVYAATSNADRGGASHMWRLTAGVGWFLIIMGYPALATVVRRLPFPRTADPRTPKQLLGSLAWWAASWFLSMVALGSHVGVAGIVAVPYAVLMVVVRRVSARGRAASTNSADTAIP